METNHIHDKIARVFGNAIRLVCHKHIVDVPIAGSRQPVEAINVPRRPCTIVGQGRCGPGSGYSMAVGIYVRLIGVLDQSCCVAGQDLGIALGRIIEIREHSSNAARITTNTSRDTDGCMIDVCLFCLDFPAGAEVGVSKRAQRELSCRWILIIFF